jgi:glucokinase
MRLLADIGGTNARFALQAQADADAHGSGFSDVEVLACSDYPTLDAALAAYLAAARTRGMAVDGLRHAAIAIATPVEGDVVAMTNHHWRFSTAALRSAFGLDTLLVVNDFAALAMALPHLGDAGRERVGPACTAPPDRPLGLIGPGTGLGVSALVPHAGRWIVLPGEGGHASFAPTTKQEIRILETLLEEHGHVSAERLLSGAGLEAIHRVLCGERLAAARISAQALDGSGGACRESVDVFCAMLGCVAGNVALTLGATGGMYIGGGIVPRLGRLFHASAFRTRFEAKGRLQPWLARVPTWVVTEPYPALRGVAAMLADHVASRAGA